MKLLSTLARVECLVEAGAGGEGGEAGFEFGINPNEDPELRAGKGQVSHLRAWKLWPKLLVMEPYGAP